MVSPDREMPNDPVPDAVNQQNDPPVNQQNVPPAAPVEGSDAWKYDQHKAAIDKQAADTAATGIAKM